MSAILLNSGGAENNPRVVNAFSTGDLPYAELEIPLIAESWFVLPADETRTHVFFFPLSLGGSFYVSPFGINAGSGFPFTTAGGAVSFSHILHGRIVQSEWFIGGSAAGATIGVGVARAGSSIPRIESRIPSVPTDPGKGLSPPVAQPVEPTPRRPARWPSRPISDPIWKLPRGL